MRRSLSPDPSLCPAVLTPHSIGSLLMFTFCSLGPDDLKVETGDDATLLCVDPKRSIPSMLRWDRLDLKSHGTVYFHRDGHAVENFQLSSFRGRVELIDPDMKGGNMSVTLRNVTAEDAGTYECWRAKDRARRGKRDEPELINAVELKVEKPGELSSCSTERFYLLT